jgi:lysophospholipase L1-like esterase
MSSHLGLVIYVARRIAVAVVVGAGVAGAFTLIEPHLGLRLNQQSVFYVWLGLSRTQLAEIAAAGLALGLIAMVFSFARHPRVWAANTTLVLLSLGVSVLACELIARVTDQQPVFALRDWLAERNALVTTSSTVVEFDPLLGWVHKSNYANPAASFTTGQFGIRLNQPHHYQLPKQAILAVGDSFTAGDEVGDGGTWPALLEGILQRPVINGATGGWGTDQIVLRAEDLLPKLEPSIVIVSFFEDDIRRANLRLFQGANKPFFTIENGSLFLNNRPVPRNTIRPGELPTWLGVLRYSYLVQFVMDRYGPSPSWQKFSMRYVAVDNDPVAVSCALLKRLQGELAARRVSLLLVMEYARSVDFVKPPQAVGVLECAHQQGIDALDLWDDLKALHDRSFHDYLKLWNSYHGQNTSGHMSVSGNRLVAESIAAKLSESNKRK